MPITGFEKVLIEGRALILNLVDFKARYRPALYNRIATDSPVISSRPKVNAHWSFNKVLLIRKYSAISF